MSEVEMWIKSKFVYFLTAMYLSSARVLSTIILLDIWINDFWNLLCN